ncbi:MAG: hypothetical protein LQ346_003574 [Caloplaca aetnensis]|nr:MAG: hypothetical protein LQ346_003574 [Caloplaca aetnensis]
MYVSAASLILTGLLSSNVWERSSAAAVPGKPEKTGLSAVQVGYILIIRRLDSYGELVWTETENGKLTYFSDDMANKAIANMTAEGWRPSNTKEDFALQKRWSGWTNVGWIGQKAAKYACIDSGAWIADGTVSGLYDQACKQFVSDTPTGLTVDGV